MAASRLKNHGAAQLPAFVKKGQFINDGHLLELARKNAMQPVTFDKGIPGGHVHWLTGANHKA